MDIELLTADEVAQVLRVSRYRVYELARDGRLGGAIRLGRQLRVDHGRLKTWLAAGGEGLPGKWRREAKPPVRGIDVETRSAKRAGRRLLSRNVKP